MFIRTMLALVLALGLLAPLTPAVDNEQDPPPNCLPCRG